MAKKNSEATRKPTTDNTRKSTGKPSADGSKGGTQQPPASTARKGAAPAKTGNNPAKAGSKPAKTGSKPAKTGSKPAKTGSKPAAGGRGSAAPDGKGTAPDKRRVTFELPDEVDADEVHLCGDFNDWDRTATPLTKRKDGRFSRTLTLATGRTYRYRYLLDGQRWENDWDADHYIPNDFGGNDSVVDLTTD